MINIGVTVEIVPGSRSYGGKFSGRVGETKRASCAGGKVAIRFGDTVNPRSAYGVFWFDEHELRICEDTTNQEENLMLPGYKRAEIKFLDGKNTTTTYSYALYDDCAAPGDLVAVRTGHHGFTLAVIAEVYDTDLNLVKCGREIIAPVSLTAYNARRGKEERLRTLKASMDAKAKDMQQLALYEMLAEKDPAMAAMLEEYRALLIQ